MGVTASLTSGGERKKRAHKCLCGVPQEKCTGSIVQTTRGLKSAIKMHGTPPEAFKCYSNYLIGLGYKQMGPREFYLPGATPELDGPVVVLTKKIRFGCTMRGGKGSRQMSRRDALGGVVISS